MGYMNTAAENDMVLKYIPLVSRIVARIDTGEGELDKDDLFSVGVIGLIDAVKKFDSGKSVPFEAYAAVRIKGSIIDEMRKSGRVSRDRIVRLNQYYSAKEKLEQQLMRSPDEQMICDEMGITEKELFRIHETVHYLSKVSFEATLFQKDGGETQLADLLKDESTDSPEEEYVKKERKQILSSAIEKLNDREKTILSLYYVEELTLKEIAYAMGISIPRVSQIHGKIILKLREQMA
jgi:RNA polymerase sigma factor for flagellar operon FliA